MRLSKQQKQDISRFGCTFLANQQVIWVGLEQAHRVQASKGSIIARSIYNKMPSGPLLCLAFEFSPTKALSRYSYFPFDLRKRLDRDFISEILKKNEIPICLLVGSRTVSRSCKLSPYLSERLRGHRAMALEDAKQFPKDHLDFAKAVSEFEGSLRVVQHFDYAMSYSDVASRALQFKIKAVSSEHRIEANKVVKELLAIPYQRRERWVGRYLNELIRWARTLRALVDLKEYYQGDFDGFAGYLSDALAIASGENLESVKKLLPVVEAVCKLMDQAEERITAQYGVDEFIGIVKRANEQGLSISALQSLLSCLGFQLGGKPGRSPEDYSNDYALRECGKKWSEVADHRLQTHPELQQEFVKNRYKYLSSEQKRTLLHRIKEGVRSYAQRAGKPFPRPSNMKSPIEGQ